MYSWSYHPHNLQHQGILRVYPVFGFVDIDDFEVFEMAPVLLNGKDVGHDLAGVVVIGQGIDDRHISVFP